ncbi:MAG: hypothetical protein SGBAC_013010, partial [Bacillariaceae sp.]
MIKGASDTNLRRVLSTIHDDDLTGTVGPCDTVEYDAVVYTRKHIFVVAAPKQAKSGTADCPILAMEQSAALATTTSTSQRMVNMHKAFKRTQQEADTVKEYDLILNNGGDFIGQMMTNLNVTLVDNSFAQFIAVHLASTYSTIAQEMRENPNTWNELVADMEDKEALSDIELIELLIESKISHLYEPSIAPLKEIYKSPSNNNRRRLKKIEMEEQDVGASSGRRLASGVECGKWYSSSCLSETDVRYDPDGSDNIVDQNPAWSKFEGLFEGTATSYGPDGRVFEPSFVGADSDGSFGDSKALVGEMPYTQAPYRMFLNLTIAGTRYYEQALFFYPPANQDFCAQTVPDGMTNAYAPGDCGLNGTAGFYERFGTSSFDRDGSVTMLQFCSTPDGETLDRKSYVSIPAGDGNHFSSYKEGNFLVQYTSACLDAKCDQLTTTIDYYDTSGSEKFRVVASTRILFNRLASAEAFKTGIKDAFMEYAVPENQLPLEDVECFSGFCPAEDDWCQFDPNCADSPYVEPEAYVLAGPVIALVMAAVMVIFGVLYLLHRRAMMNKEEFVRKKFADRIAE